MLLQVALTATSVRTNLLTSFGSNVTITNVGMHALFEDGDWEDFRTGDSMDLDMILEGDDAMPLSHAGGELAEVLEKEMRQER